MDMALKRYLTKKELIDIILARQHHKHPRYYLYSANFIPNMGWYAYAYQRNDIGVFIGATFEEAIAAAANIYEVEKCLEPARNNS